MSQELKPCECSCHYENLDRCEECCAGPAPQAQGAGKWGPEDVIGDCWGATNDDGRIPFKVKDCKPEVQALLSSAPAERDMTNEEAQAEAEKRWGPQGWAHFEPITNKNHFNYGLHYRVGRVVEEHGGLMRTLGVSTSYRAAFAAADRAAKEWKKPKLKKNKVTSICNYRHTIGHKCANCGRED